MVSGQDGLNEVIINMDSNATFETGEVKVNIHRHIKRPRLYDYKPAWGCEPQ